MKYEAMHKGTFLRRPNRFIAHVEIDGTEQVCHVKNTGRCRELLPAGATVWCQHHDDPHRKTAWSLITVQKGQRLINMDSQAPNKAAFDYVSQGGLGFLPKVVKTEQVYGSSRFDLYFETDDGRQGYVEVKGVTLEREDVAYFPDAPTERGAKHVRELAEAARHGLQAYLLFVVQMEDILRVEPNRDTDPDFAAALVEAQAAGVHLCAVGCKITPETMICDAPIPVVI